jgi:hypothetical protein
MKQAPPPFKPTQEKTLATQDATLQAKNVNNDAKIDDAHQSSESSEEESSEESSQESSEKSDLEVQSAHHQEEEASDSPSLYVVNIVQSGPPDDQVSPLTVDKNMSSTRPAATAASNTTRIPPPGNTNKQSGSFREKLARASSSISIPHYSRKAERRRCIIANALVLVVITCVVTVLIIRFD